MTASLENLSVVGPDELRLYALRGLSGAHVSPGMNRAANAAILKNQTQRFPATIARLS